MKIPPCRPRHRAVRRGRLNGHKTCIHGGAIPIPADRNLKRVCPPVLDCSSTLNLGTSRVQAEYTPWRSRSHQYTAQDSLISPRKRKCDGARHKTKKLLKVSKVAELAQRRISEVVLEDEQTLFQERVALVFKLEQELQVLPLAQRSSLENLYTKLFGPGHNYFLDLSEEKQSDITRKRIASLVVAELEPYYAGEPKRIGNKNLFKYLAKYITELIYTMNLCPGKNES
ncbi:uncharacterized protein LOC103517075 [Diaphorina citri]|uniref:Uncharacterized protein LOC103517075 n=1 Tax=Diaphorina citri TaxID=121845 RepID=A0A3Q0J9G6_DIACI|nr:uncharacterized protein LOC103517075 [Diaphorina citri]